MFCIWLFGPITHLGWGSAYGMMLRVIFVYLDLNVLVPYMGGGCPLSVELPSPSAMSYPHSSVSDFLHRPLVSHLSAYTLLLHRFRLPWSLQFYISLQTGDCEFSELLFSKLFCLPDSFAFLSEYILDAFLFTALKKKRKEKKKTNPAGVSLELS